MNTQFKVESKKKKSSQQIHVHEYILKIDLQAANIESKFLSEHVLNTGSHDWHSLQFQKPKNPYIFHM